LLSAKKLPPGKSGHIEVSVKTESLWGAVEKRVQVLTNDPSHSAVTLSIKMTVEPEIDLSESMIFFGNAPKGKEIRREILLTLPAGKSIKILSAASTDPDVVVRLEPLPGSEDKKLRLIAIQRADAKPGDHIGTIVLKTSSRLTPDITIYVRGSVAPAR